MSPSGKPRNGSASAPTAAACARRARLRCGGGGGKAAPSPPPAPAVLDIPLRPYYKEAANLMSVSGKALINIISSFAAA